MKRLLRKHPTLSFAALAKEISGAKLGNEDHIYISVGSGENQKPVQLELCYIIEQKMQLWNWDGMLL